MIFSRDPPVLPTRNTPATIPPTTDGQISLVSGYCFCNAMSSLVVLSGIPSATVNIASKNFVSSACLITVGAVRNEAKLINTVAQQVSACSRVVICGMIISLSPRKTFTPRGCFSLTITATILGVRQQSQS